MSAQQDALVDHEVQLRFTDFDVLGHVNHSVYQSLLEQARIHLLGLLSGHDQVYVMAHVEMDYRHEVTIPTTYVTVQSRIERIGRSSLSLFQHVVRPDGEVATEATVVLVAWDPAARRSRILSDAERARFERLLSPATVD